MKQNIKNIIIILSFCFIIIPLFLYLIGINKKTFEGLCNSNFDISKNCVGTDVSNCLIGKKSVTCIVKDCPTEKTCPVPAPIKCMADFGTSIGDPLCCGQEGVLQDTRYVCPNTQQTCGNFKCGSAFGTCS